MKKLYENFHIFHFQKRIVSAETIRGYTVVNFFVNICVPNIFSPPIGLPSCDQSFIFEFKAVLALPKLCISLHVMKVFYFDTLCFNIS
jgi:hypothetical protein